jgi:two-component system OmpR family sensor kinase
VSTGFTLRRRLIAGILLLIAAVSVTIGAVSAVALRGYLMDRLDDQVSEAVARFEVVSQRPGVGAGAPLPGPILPLAGLPPETIGAFVRGNTVQAAVLGRSLDSEPITTEQVLLLLNKVSPDAEPVTVDLGGTFGDYRFVGNSDGAGGGVIIGMPLTEVNSTVLQLILVIAIVAGAGLIAAGIAGTAIVRLSLRPLDRVAETASRVAELPLERGEVALAERVSDADADPRTEVGRVGAAINRMLGHIASALSAREASERKVRTFVADASHELRTPLASIRGYAELTRRGGHKLPKDVAHALSRIESESVRMTSLVEDLLLLARLDDGRSLEELPVDVSALLADAVSDANAAGPDHEWKLELPDEPMLVTGDAARLHQVLGNLLTNARVHTPPGTTVTASARLDGDSVELQVVDDGPGIDPAIADHVFERFARGDTSRSRAAGSTGLGLAIVEAVVTAHGGTVSATSEAGATVFTVRLPRVGVSATPLRAPSPA